VRDESKTSRNDVVGSAPDTALEAAGGAALTLVLALCPAALEFRLFCPYSFCSMFVGLRTDGRLMI